MNYPTIKRRFGILILIAFFLPLMSAGQTLLWPTHASQVMTSSFGEFRPGHFHAGIDISTWGKTGYEIFAVGDGYISRLGVSPYGYGRVLYLHLDSNETVVYGHLSKFNSQIEQIVQELQARKGRYRIQKYFGPNELSVKAGEVIAYSGQTGVGVPHLHFEIRDAANRPINPLLKGYQIADSRHPVVTAVSFTPLNSSSSVNGDYKPVIKFPQALRSGHYKLTEPVIISGDVGLGVAAYDQANGAANRFGVYELELLVNETMIFSSKYDRFSYDVTRYIVLDRDFRLESRGLGRFYKLYRDIGNKLNMYSCSEPLCGVLSYTPIKSSFSRASSSFMRLSEGTHQFLIKLKDFFGNVTIVDGTLIASEVPKIELSLCGDSGPLGGDVTMRNSQVMADVLAEVTHDEGRTWHTIAQLREDGGSGWPGDVMPSVDAHFYFPIAISHTQFNSAILRVVAQNSVGVQSYPAFAILHNKPSWDYEELLFTVEKDFYDDYVRLQIETSVPPATVPDLRYWDANGAIQNAPVHQIDLQKFVSSVPLAPNPSGIIPLEISARDLQGREKHHKQALHLRAVRLGAATRIYSEDGQCQVQFNSNSLYRDMFVRIHSAQPEDMGRYDLASRAFAIEPKDVPMKAGAWVRIKYDATEKDPSKLGLYFETNNRKWRFLDNNHDSNLAISGRVKSFGTYALVRDTIPPQINRFEPANESRLASRTPLLRAKFRDLLSGVSGEDNMVLRIDGVRLIAEYDPERFILFHKVKKPLSSGRHDVSLMVRDRCGNVAERKNTFWVE